MNTRTTNSTTPRTSTGLAMKTNLRAGLDVPTAALKLSTSSLTLQTSLRLI